MKNNLTLQLIASALCIIFAIVFLNPFHYLMTDMAHMVILGVVAAAFGAFAILILLETGGDERELTHRAYAGRTGFLIGGAILLVAIVWQALKGPVDPWLGIALCGMVAGKAIARLYCKTRL